MCCDNSWKASSLYFDRHFDIRSFILACKLTTNLKFLFGSEFSESISNRMACTKWKEIENDEQHSLIRQSILTSLNNFRSGWTHVPYFQTICVNIHQSYPSLLRLVTVKVKSWRLSLSKHSSFSPLFKDDT